MRKKIVILCSILAMACAGCGTTSQTTIQPRQETATNETTPKTEETVDETAEASEEQTNLFADADATLTMGYFDSTADAMVGYYKISGLPSSGTIGSDQYWLYGESYGDLKTAGSDTSIQTVGDLSQIDGAVWDVKFYESQEEGTTYCNITCNDDWELAKSANDEKPNYEENTYKDFDYFTYDGESGDESVYLAVHAKDSDKYLSFQISRQKDGNFLTFPDKQGIIETMMDHISLEKSTTPD